MQGFFSYSGLGAFWIGGFLLTYLSTLGGSIGILSHKYHTQSAAC